MSNDLRHAIEENQPYLKSGIDDLESLYWVFLWAIIFNIYIPSITRWQNLLRGTVPARQFVSTENTGDYLEPSEHSALVYQFSPFLKLWSTKLRQLRSDWRRRTALQTIPLHEGKFWPSQCHEFAYRGVCDILEVVKQYRSELSQFPFLARQLDDPSASQRNSTKRGRDEEDDRLVSAKKQKGTIDS